MFFLPFVRLGVPPMWFFSSFVFVYRAGTGTGEEKAY
jgi:hypothetical protein